MQDNEAFQGIGPPSLFYEFQLECKRHQEEPFRLLRDDFLLPPLGKLWNEEIFAKAYMAWSETALYFTFVVESSPWQVFYPQVSRGDSIELFVDTKNLKSARLATRFCHHFFFLPERIEGLVTGEITHFRTEDTHPLCNPDDIEYKVTHTKKGYRADFVLTERCLVGFQPTEGACIGLSYRVNRFNGSPQHFAPSSLRLPLDQCPYLWPEVRLR